MTTTDLSDGVVSYGGGVQSTALLVLAAKGYIPHRTFLFSNVGDDSEHPETLSYVREVAFDYAAKHGIRLEELHKEPTRGRFAGQRETLYASLMHPDSRSIQIPVRMADTGSPGNRRCTTDFKHRVVGQWLQRHGATAATPVRVAIGISTDEWERASSRRETPHELPEYPLLTLEWRGRRGLSRNDCEQAIRDAGLPVPRKSSCYFCPFHKPSEFADLARTAPVLFEKACHLEDTINGRRDTLGKDHVYLTRFGRPLRDVIDDSQQALFEDPAWDEDEGYRCGDVCDT